MKDKKKLLIGVLCCLIVIMAIGYALLSQQLNITGSAAITSNWQVEITDIKEVANVGSGRTISTDYNATTANIDGKLIHTGDKLTYEITITNKGSLDAVLENYTANIGNNDAFIVTFDNDDDFYMGMKLPKNGGTVKARVSVQYNPDSTKQPNTSNTNLTITFSYQQDLGQIQPYQSYDVGDIVSFAGSNWIVMKKSLEKENYVTVIKETVLTSDEIDENYQTHLYWSNETNNMPFYWSATCHDENTVYETSHYPTSDYSGCEGHNSWEESRVKSFLEGPYISTLGASNLKKVDGYKIRLLKFDELINNFGFEYVSSYGGYYRATDNTPEWITSFPNSNNYFIMDVPPNASPGAAYDVNVFGSTVSGSWVCYQEKIRPVINLYKDSIEN